jgi:hypothetical protein
VARLDDLDDLFGGGGEDDNVGLVFFDGVAIALVDNEVAGSGQQSTRAHNTREFVDEFH